MGHPQHIVDIGGENHKMGESIKRNPYDKRSAFWDEHIVSAYQQVQANNARMKDEIVYATSSAPYHRRRNVWEEPNTGLEMLQILTGTEILT